MLSNYRIQQYYSDIRDLQGQKLNKNLPKKLCHFSFQDMKYY